MQLCDRLGPATELDLSRTKATDVFALAGFTNLSSLDLTLTQVADLRPLAGLANLETLWLRSTRVPKEVARLREALPNLRIQ